MAENNRTQHSRRYCLQFVHLSRLFSIEVQISIREPVDICSIPQTKDGAVAETHFPLPSPHSQATGGSSPCQCFSSKPSHFSLSLFSYTRSDREESVDNNDANFARFLKTHFSGFPTSANPRHTISPYVNHIAAAIMDEVVIEGFGKNNVFENETVVVGENTEGNVKKKGGKRVNSDMESGEQNVKCVGLEGNERWQNQGISSTAPLLANSSEEAPVLSPLVPVSSLGGSKGEDQKQKAVTKRETVQAILKGIKQSPKKVNLVAALVRGMLVKDALIQLELTIKRAAKTVYQVIHSARANASHNHGLDPERLIVAEAFVGKGFFKKRISFHGAGKSGIRMRPECRLTVVVREITPKEEADIARLRVHNFKKLSKRERRLVPHQLIETTPVWGRKNKSTAQNFTAATTA
ncbi:hypothetical protein V8G54_022126 [Vigna mungo]|uniref:Large ribosomal subunit protein uL22c n=1 Tax=Vigna mungo TaxID=3915 RepID=A0AAQ3NFI1_VIGMU